MMQVNMQRDIVELAKKYRFCKKDTDEIIEYLEHDEWGLAYEVLCCVIVENKIILIEDDLNKIKQIGIKMEMDANLWKNIKLSDKNIKSNCRYD